MSHTNVMTRARSPLIALNNGVEMPAIGLGAFEGTDPAPTASAIVAAVAMGYRLVDTAAAYLNERQVGEGIQACGIARSELFVTSKLWIADYGYDSALRAFDVSLRKLGLEYLDLYLLHWPVPTNFAATIASYKALEKLLADGRVRAIGVSNFNPDHLERLIAQTDVVPAVNQVELHPFFIQRAVRESDARRGVVTQAWSPLGGVMEYMPQAGGRKRSVLSSDAVVELAQTCDKTPAQIVLGWHRAHGLAAVPKSIHPDRIAENIDVFDFKLTPENVAAIDGLDTGIRGGPDPDTWDTSKIALTIPEA
jgi:diketogulonate reductase-like aldo/keto reductase